MSIHPTSKHAHSLPHPLPLFRLIQPGRGGDVNVVSEECEEQVVFRLERPVEAGEELLLDYGIKVFSLFFPDFFWLGAAAGFATQISCATRLAFQKSFSCRSAHFHLMCVRVCVRGGVRACACVRVCVCV